MKEKTVCLRTGKNVRQLAHRLADYWSDEEELRCELLRTADGTYVVQGEDRGNDLDACHLAGRTAMVWFTAAGEDRVLAVIRPGCCGRRGSCAGPPASSAGSFRRICARPGGKRPSTRSRREKAGT